MVCIKAAEKSAMLSPEWIVELFDIMRLRDEAPDITGTTPQPSLQPEATVKENPEIRQ
jgi:hypothetical protein